MTMNKQVFFGVLAILGLQCWPCPRALAAEKAEHPATVERIEGTKLSRVTLTEKAVERIGLQTDQVREENVSRKRMVKGEVVALPAGEAAALGVRVRVTRDELGKVAWGEPARVLPRDGDDQAEDDGLPARPAKVQGADDPREPTVARYYGIDGTEHGLAPEKRVWVRLPLAGKGKLRKVVPYSALIYDPQGETWVYTSPQPRTFVRASVDVDYIDGDVAVLESGPPAGTVVASVGVAELYGTEFKVGH